MIVLRSLLFNAWFFGSTFVLCVFGLFVRWLVPQRSLWLAQLWARAVLGGARLLCGIRTVVIGGENLPQGAALIASQHQSAFDTLIWLTLVPRASYVYKAELSRVPLFGPLLAAAGQIKIDRGASFAAVRSLLRGADRAVADGRQIVIFPEGTRVALGTEAALRPGFTAIAARTGLPVTPVATDSGRVWGRRSFHKRPGDVHVVIGSPIPPGVKNDALVAALLERWKEAHRHMQPVDKLVD